MIKEIVTDPEKLHLKSTSVTESDDIKEIIQDLIDTYNSKPAAGISAPQIGVYKRIFIVNLKDGPIAFINPMIIDRKWPMVTDKEGCLSVQNSYHKARHNSITLMSRTGSTKSKVKKFVFSGEVARIIQHEIDHLNGKIISD